MRKVIVLLVFVIGLVVYTNYKLFSNGNNYSYKKKEIEEIVVGEPITAGEINAFLEVWPDYVNSWVSKFETPQLSLTNSDDIKKKSSILTVIWLNRRGWDIERFFYVEQRLKAIVRSAEVNEHIYKSIEMLEKSLITERNSTVYNNIENMIAYHKKSLNIERVSQKEVDMVRPNLSEIIQILYPERFEENKSNK